MKKVALAFLGLVICATFARESLAVPVDVEVKGKVFINTFASFPFGGTPVGADVTLKFRVESASGFQVRPGCTVGLTVYSAHLNFSDSDIGPISLPIGTNLPYTMPLFATSAIVPSIPDQDEIDFGCGIKFDVGSVHFFHCLRLADADNASWPTADFAQLSACGYPESNFMGPNPDDFKHWYLLGDILDSGMMNFKFESIRRVALTVGDGDMNANGQANGADLQAFVDAVLVESTDAFDVCHGDFTSDGEVSTNDVPGMVQKLLTGVGPTPPAPFGACCRLDENFQWTCVETPSEAACLALAGSDHRYGFGKHCAELDPICGGGACCMGNGNCVQVGTSNPFQACTQLGGTFIGEGVACSPNVCPGAPGACCLVDAEFGQPSGVCSMLSLTQCNQIGGLFSAEGVSCNFNPCAGACCVEGEACEVLPAWLCTGTYQGDGTSCEYSPCPPANDDCADAIVVGAGSYDFTLLGATTDGDEPPSSSGCPLGFDPDNFVARDIWFNYIAECTALVQIDTCTSYFGGDSADTTIAVYSDCGTCPPDSLTQMIACNESHSTGAPVQHCLDAFEDASMRFLVEAGVCYKIRVGTTTGLTYGRGTLNITCGGACCPPGGPLCILASEADCTAMGGTFAGNGVDCASNTCP